VFFDVCGDGGTCWCGSRDDCEELQGCKTWEGEGAWAGGLVAGGRSGALVAETGIVWSHLDEIMILGLREIYRRRS